MHRIQGISISAIAMILALASTAWAAGNPELVEAQRQYRQERSHCLSGRSHQDRATCMKEAGAAYTEARRGALAVAGSADFERNATRRCDAQPPADRAACAQRMLGTGKTQGSVEGGGLIRRTEARLP